MRRVAWKRLYHRWLPPILSARKPEPIREMQPPTSSVDNMREPATFPKPASTHIETRWTCGIAMATQQPIDPSARRFCSSLAIGEYVMKRQS